MSDVEICNLALTQLGAARIISLSENSENARRLNAVYEPIRDFLLRLHPWNFAIKRSYLAQLADTPSYEYSYYHQLPTDCLRVLTASDSTNQITDYKIEGRKLVSDETAVYIKYIAKVTDPNEFDSVFIMAFSSSLAAFLTYSITSGKSFMELITQICNEQLRLARAIDGQESSSIEEQDLNSWTIDNR